MSKNLDSRSTVLAVLLIFIGLFSGISGQSDDKEDCTALSSMVGLLQKQMVPLALCATELKPQSSNYLCVVKCALTKINILTPEGTVNYTGAIEFMQNIPQSMRNVKGGSFSKCQEALAQIVPNDETCQSYQPLISCGLQAITSSLSKAIPQIAGGGSGGGLGGLLGGESGGGIGRMLGGGSGAGLGGLLGGGSGAGLGGLLGGGSGGGIGRMLGGVGGRGLGGLLGGGSGGGLGGLLGGGSGGRLGGLLGGGSRGGIGKMLGGVSGGGLRGLLGGRSGGGIGKLLGGGLGGGEGGAGGINPLKMLSCVDLAGQAGGLVRNLDLNALRRMF